MATEIVKTRAGYTIRPALYAPLRPSDERITETGNYVVLNRRYVARKSMSRATIRGGDAPVGHLAEGKHGWPSGYLGAREADDAK